MCRLGRTRQHVESEVSAKIAARSRCIGTAPKGTAKACRQGKRNRVDCQIVPHLTSSSQSCCTASRGKITVSMAA